MKPARVAAILGLAQLFVALAIAMASNAEGWIGGALYAGMYAAPLLVLATMLGSSRHALRAAAGWTALALAVFYAAVVVANWPTYSEGQAIAAIVLTAPTVAVEAAIFWIEIVRREGRPTSAAA